MRLTGRGLKPCLRIGARAALGLFILWQLLFLLAANFLELAKEKRATLAPTLEKAITEIAPGCISEEGEVQAAVETAIEWTAPGWTRKEGAVHEVVERVTEWTKAWSLLSGQPQGWTLFTPPGDECPFPVVELRWDEAPPAPWDVVPRLAPLAAGNALAAAVLAAVPGPGPPLMAYEPEMLRSANEPPDPNSYLRLGKFRLRRYESSIGVILVSHADEPELDRKERWRSLIEDYFRREWETVYAYLRWRLAEYRQAHPERLPPRQVILHVRRYHIFAPEEAGDSPWDEPDLRPIARWRPCCVCPTSHVPVEMFDPETDSFEWRRR
jgi:hypothetical protein